MHVPPSGARKVSREPLLLRPQYRQSGPRSPGTQLPNVIREVAAHEVTGEIASARERPPRRFVGILARAGDSRSGTMLPKSKALANVASSDGTKPSCGGTICLDGGAHALHPEFLSGVDTL